MHAQFCFFSSVDPDLFSDYCRDEFDEEKEPDSMVLAGWSGPAGKQITSSGEKVILLVFT
jgi:hypothetical protein